MKIANFTDMKALIQAALKMKKGQETVRVLAANGGAEVRVVMGPAIFNIMLDDVPPVSIKDQIKFDVSNGTIIEIIPYAAQTEAAPTAPPVQPKAPSQSFEKNPRF